MAHAPTVPKILVTGADGYIGTMLCADLMGQGYDVHGLDTGYFRSGWLFPSDLPRPAIQTRDIRNLSPTDFEGFDAVIHLAELSNDPLGDLDPAITDAINHRGSHRLAQMAKAAGVRRFVYMSSCSVYGVGVTDWVDETSPVNPQTAYARCKVAMEEALSEMADDDFSPVMFRNATAYGASPRMRFDLVLNNLTAWAWTTQTLKLQSDGSPWRPIVHILDIAQAIRLALQAPRENIHGQILNVGSSGQNYQVKDIADIIHQESPHSSVSFGPPSLDNRSYRVKFDKIQSFLPEFQCQWDALKGVRQLLALFEAMQLSLKDFESRHYTRMKQLVHYRQTGELDAAYFWANPTLLHLGLEPLDNASPVTPTGAHHG